jgi:hypothetical protein
MSYSSSVIQFLTVAAGTAAQHSIIPRLFVAAGICLPNRRLAMFIFRLAVTEKCVSEQLVSKGLFWLSGVMSQYIQ